VGRLWKGAEFWKSRSYRLKSFKKKFLGRSQEPEVRSQNEEPNHNHQRGVGEGSGSASGWVRLFVRFRSALKLLSDNGGFAFVRFPSGKKQDAATNGLE
jgi:hypothetical protein